jgi:hypothetical protein
MVGIAFNGSVIYLQIPQGPDSNRIRELPDKVSIK